MGPLPDLRLTVPLGSFYLTTDPGEAGARLSLRRRHCPTFTEHGHRPGHCVHVPEGCVACGDRLVTPLWPPRAVLRAWRRT